MFRCPKIQLAVELDGQPHFEEEGIDYDNKRSIYLKNEGIHIKRFENQEVVLDTDRVLKELEILCEELVNKNIL